MEEWPKTSEMDHTLGNKRNIHNTPESDLREIFNEPLVGIEFDSIKEI